MLHVSATTHELILIFFRPQTWSLRWLHMAPIGHATLLTLCWHLKQKQCTRSHSSVPYAVEWQ